MDGPSLLDPAELRDAARGLLAAAEAQELSPEALWNTMLEAGWLALGVSEDSGGLGQPMLTVAALLEEVGRRPCTQPLISATAAAAMLDLLSRQGSAQARELLDAALSGRARVVCGDLDPACAPLAGFVPSIVLGDVPHAAVATHLVFAAKCAQRGEVLLALAGEGGGLQIEPRSGWDETRQYGRVVVNTASLDAATSLMAAAAGAGEAIRRGRAVLDLAIAGDSLGGAAAVLEATIVYMKQRVQFGRAIASFQALKHRCADLATEVAAARAALMRACAAMDADRPDAPLRAALARLAAGAAYCAVADEALQMHGGIGFTWEHACHRYLKRARSAETIGGSRAARLDAIAAELLGEIRGERILAT